MRIVVTGGGTGGHIYPALAISRYAQEHMNAQILYIGTVKGLEREIVPRTGIDSRYIEVEGLKRQVSLRAFKTVWMAMTATLAARRELKSFSPDLVLGTGGYVVVPVILAAFSLGIPTAILEMDAHAGLANRLVSRITDKVMLAMAAGESAFAHAKNVVVTGNPRATEAVESARASRDKVREELNLHGLPLVTIVSGSRGANPINQAVLSWLTSKQIRNFQVVWITGEVHYEQMKAEFQKSPYPSEMIQILPYYHELPALISISSLIVSRAGATILAELTALGVPAILVPSPYVTHRHQDVNAQTLVSEGAAVLLPEDELSEQRIAQEVETLIGNPFLLENMKKSSKKLGQPNALEKIGIEMLSVIHKEGYYSMTN